MTFKINTVRFLDASKMATKNEKQLKIQKKLDTMLIT